MNQVTKTNKYYFCRTCLSQIKLIFYIYCWIETIIYIRHCQTVSKNLKNKEYDVLYDDFNDYNYYGGNFASFLIADIFCIIVYLQNLCYFYCFSRTWYLLYNKIKDNTTINSIMNGLFKEKPEVNIVCSCYHYETSIKTSTSYMGKYETRTISTEVKKIETYKETIQLNLFSYLDISGLFRLKETNKKYIILELGKEINFNDELTLYDIENIKNELYLKNRYKDTFISITVERIIPTMKELYLINLTNQNNCLIQKWVFILSNILMIDTIYKLYFNCICSYQFFVIRKIVSSRKNVLENEKYSQFIPGFNSINDNYVANRNDVGGTNNEINIVLPTEEEIEKAKIYNKYIPDYKINENGEVANMNQCNIDSVINITEENNENKNIELKNNGNDKYVNIYNSLDNIKAQPLIDNKE